MIAKLERTQSNEKQNMEQTQLNVSLKTLFWSSEYLIAITASITIEDMLASSCFIRNVSVCLIKKRWQLSCRRF